MHQCQIRYRNSQGTLLRILLAATRRGLDLHSGRAEPEGASHRATLQLEANARQLAQLGRDWRAIVDVLEVGQPMPQGDA